MKKTDTQFQTPTKQRYYAKEPNKAYKNNLKKRNPASNL
jgi:hypothetical protein